jgi:hypothetical protein
MLRVDRETALARLETKEQKKHFAALARRNARFRRIFPPVPNSFPWLPRPLWVMLGMSRLGQSSQ